MSTSTNLNEAFAGESQASQKYRAFARKAEQDGLPNVARLFRTAAEAETEGHRARFMFGYALKAEAVHAGLYKRALEAVEQGKDLAEAGFYLCPVCGNIEFGAPPDKCPICGTRKEKFVAVA